MSVPKDHQATRSAAEPGSSTLRPDTVFRLRGVPDRFQRSDIPGLLREAFGESDEFPVEVGSLAQSPHRVGEKVATVALPDASRVLTRINTIKDNEKEWPLSLDLREGSIVDLHLDTHFHGFTPLHNGEDAECTREFHGNHICRLSSDKHTSIIAISGLNAHAFGSFKQRGGPWMWLRDGLPTDLPNTRIFTYGYDTQLEGSLSVQNLTDLGISLSAALNDLFQTTYVMVAVAATKIVEALTRNMQADSCPRPLLFVGHSLGGLVIKEACLQMKKPMYAQIVEATCGFFFFGVPNYGMAIESLVPIVDNGPNRSFLETLGRNSAMLLRLQEQFSTTFLSESVRMIGFYETKMSPTACKVNGIWKMQGPESLLVEYASATAGGYQHHAINRDHSDMVKFNSKDDPNYRAVLSYLRQLNNGLTSLQRGSTAALSEDDKACLSSLAFPGQEWHKDGVVSVGGTCDWIFSHDIFQDWNTDPRQLLWIRGNPGTGKSTMMKHMFDFFEKHRPEGQTLATFFFNAKEGENMSLTTPLSLYRALLNQILYQSPEYLPELTAKFKTYKDARNGSWRWSVNELRHLLAKVVPAISAKRHICILVDALDESGEENARQLIGQFQEILALADKTGGVLKICFSCRHYPVLTLKDGLTITMEIENRKDIKTFVKTRLRPFKRDARLLEKAIMQKSNGVFQWAKLVTDQALDLQMAGKQVEVILRRIQRIPKQLEEVYESLLSWPDDDEGQESRRKALELFQWLFFATKPFTFSMVRCVLDIDDQMKDTPTKEYLEDVRSMEDEKRVRRAVRTLSRGLLEFHVDERLNRDYVLQPIHQTVREYLLEKGLRQLQFSPVGGSLAEPHYQIFKTSVKFLFLKGSLKEPIAKNEYRFRFLEYSLRYLGYHFWRTDQKKIDPEQVLDLFRWPSKSQIPTEWSKCLGNNFNSPEDHLFPTFIGSECHFNWPRSHGSTLLHLAAFVGNIRILESAIKRDNNHYLHVEDAMGWTPLSIAIEGGHEEFAMRILSHSQDFKIKEIDLYDGNGTTTIMHEAARKGMNTTLKKLLDIGVNVDGPEGFRPSPLFLAAYEGQLETCQILLNNQANPEISLRYWGTPLSLAIRERHKEMCCLLVQNRDEEPSHWPAPTKANVYNALWPRKSDEGDEESEVEFNYADSIFAMISSKEDGDLIREVLGPISTPLHDACARGNTKVVSFLISNARFDVNCKDGSGRTPLFRAVQDEQDAMVEWLFQNHEVCYLSRDDWSQLPGSTTVRETYRQMVEKYWSGIPGPPLSQRQEDPNIEQYRQWALEAFEDSQYCREPEVDDGSSLQGSVEFERNASSFPPTMHDNYEERNAKRRRIDGDRYL